MKIGRLTMCAALLSMGALTGCGLPGAPLPPSLELPRKVGDLKAERKGSKVTLTWTPPQLTTDRQRIRRAGPTRVCRSIGPALAAGTAAAPCTEIASIKPNAIPVQQTSQEGKRAQVTFVDTIPADLQAQHSNESALYTVEVFNDLDRTAGASNEVSVPLAPTLPPPSQVDVKLTHEGPILTWGMPPEVAVKMEEAQKRRGGISYSFRVLRKDKDKPTAAPVAVAGEVGPTVEQSQPTFTMRDERFEWGRTYAYTVSIMTTARVGGKDEQVAGEESAAAEVTTRDIFPPAIPTGLQAVYTETGTQRYVDLTWLPTTEQDFAGYNIFRREEGTQPVKINSEPLKTPTFHDAGIAPGHRYYYSVSATDARGNESAHSREASETVPQPR